MLKPPTFQSLQCAISVRSVMPLAGGATLWHQFAYLVTCCALTNCRKLPHMPCFARSGKWETVTLNQIRWKFPHTSLWLDKIMSTFAVCNIHKVTLQGVHPRHTLGLWEHSAEDSQKTPSPGIASLGLVGKWSGIIIVCLRSCLQLQW